jgi:PEGA domain
VRASASTRVIVDGRAAVAAPTTISGLPLGEHYLRIEEAGHVPWGTVVVVAAPFAEVSIPERALLTLDDRAAAGLGQRAGAPFVLLVTPTSLLGASSSADARVELTLLRAVDASRRDSVVARLDRGEEALAQAMTRLLEARFDGAARSATALASSPDAGASRPSAERGRWWWWAGTAVAIVGAGVVTALIVHDRGGSMGAGFTVTADPRRASP